MADIEKNSSGYKTAKPLGYQVLHVCKKCYEPMGKDATKPHMVCGHCQYEWCWSCEWELDHWFHHYQGDEKIFCNLLNDIYFGTDRFEYPPAVRGVALFLIFALGPWVAALIGSLIIICIFFVMLFSVIKISIRWHKEHKKLKEDPHAADQYANMQAYASVQSQSYSQGAPNKADRYRELDQRNPSIASNKSGHTPDVEVIPGTRNPVQSPAVVPQAVKAGSSIASKKKLNKADFMFKSLQNQTLIKMPGQINGIDFMIKDLDNCIVVILDHTAQIQVDRCKNTKFYIGPVKSSIFLRDCSKCEITVSCSQFRCRDLKNSKVMLYTPNDPIIESSSNLTFGPFNMKYPQLEEHSGADCANVIGKFTDDDGDVLDKRNQWNKIFDFTTKEGGNNFSLVDPQDFKMYQINSLVKEVKFEVPNKDWIYDLDEAFGGTLKGSDQKERKDGLQAFDIKTGQAAAQQKIDQLQDLDPATLTTKQKLDLEIQQRMLQNSQTANKIPDQPAGSKANAPTFGKKKLNRADYIFQNQQNQTLVKLPGQINGQQFKVKDLENCSVLLLDNTAQVDVDRCKNCKFYIGPITASLFIRNCTGCEVTVACSQFRSRDLNQSTVYLYSPNDPIIESSTDLTFGPWNLKYTNLEAQSETAKVIGEFKDDEGTMMMKVNKWNQIFDFTTRPDGQKNYKFVTSSEFKVQNIKDIHPELNMPQGDDSYIYELPVEFGGTLDISKIADVKQNMHAFDIKTGAQIGNAAVVAGAEEDDDKAVDHDDLNLDF